MINYISLALYVTAIAYNAYTIHRQRKIIKNYADYFDTHIEFTDEIHEYFLKNQLNKAVQSEDYTEAFKYTQLLTKLKELKK